MYTGLTGVLKIEKSSTGFDKVAYISGWSIHDNSEIIETVKLRDGHKEAFAGLQSWSASADGAIVFEENGGGHETLFKAKYLGEKVKLRLFLNDSEINGAIAGDTYFEGEGYIETLGFDLSTENGAKL